ncbi:PhoPQ-activated pathogenicity-related family protein [Echinicola marina]|nr:PhoPQ-activated pathogenicity-related family protein [Echinicola marina]
MLKPAFKLTFVILFLFSIKAKAQYPDQAIDKYLNKATPEFYAECIEKIDLKNHTQYELTLTSQRWMDYTWKHRLVILAPSNINYDKSLLYIGGGNLEDGEPVKSDRENQTIEKLEKIAHKNACVVAAVFQVPNQPLFDGRIEDEIISLTLHQFQETGNEEWPLLFPMVKSVQKAMDVVSKFSQYQLGVEINDFVLTGLSKRGWTTWLTGVKDKRVSGIAPMVIDVLNMAKSLQYQIEMWQNYSPEIQDYVDLGIPQQSNTPAGQSITNMVDPFAYKQFLTMPKMVFMGTNDPYWPIDAAKNYWDEIPGDNRLIYIPNVEHGLGNGQTAFQNLSAFLEYQCTGAILPQPALSVEKSKENEIILINIAGNKKADYIEFWEASSLEDMDFREEVWKSRRIKNDQMIVPLPKTGQKAFYLAYHYTSPEGKSYYLSSQVIRCDQNGIIP